MSQSSRTWPPRLIFNTDGNWMTKYLPERRPEKISAQLDELVDLAASGIAEIVAAQRTLLADPPPARG